MDRTLGGNEEQFQMLLMALGDIKSGICLFQSPEQSKWAVLIQKSLKDKKVCLHNIADDEEETGMPLITDFKRWASESGADVVIVYNLQLLGLRYGDRETVEHLNFMRDQIQAIGKLFLLGVSPYFALLLSRNARDLYSCIRYHFNFTERTAEDGMIEISNCRELSGDYTLEIEKYWEYKSRAEDKVGEEQVRLYLECMDCWKDVRGNLPLQEKEDIMQMASRVDQFCMEKELGMPEVVQIWILADTWLELGEKEKCLSWLKLAEDKVRTALGTGHRIYADALVRLADYYQLASNYEQCEKYYDQALRIYEDHKVPLDERYQDTLMKRAVMYRRRYQYDQALAIYEKILRYYTGKYGSGFSGNATCLNNIGRVYEELGDASGALAKFQEALELLLASGERNYLLSALYNNISAIYLNNGDLKNAWKYIKLAKKETESLYGPDSEHMIRIYNSMAGIWMERERLDKAMEYLKKAMELIKRTHSGETEQAAVVLNNIANALIQGNSPLQAIPLFRRALELRLKINGERDQLTADIYEGLSLAFYGIGDSKQYREYSNKALDIYRELHRETPPR